jgi:predicted amidophosphoribosyltransferase
VGVRLRTALLGAARDLLLGERCAGCGRDGAPDGLCRTCRAGVVPEPFEVRPALAREGFPFTVAASAYTGVVRRLVVTYKEQGRLAAAQPLAALLAASVAVAAPGDGPVLLVPVPSRPGMRRRRGHDPLGRLTTTAALRLPREVHVLRAVRHVRRVADQAGLSRAERWDNLDGAFALVPGAAAAIARAGSRLVLVDDVCSSGATLAAVAAALPGEWRPPVAAVVAAPPLRQDRRPVPARRCAD